MVVLLVPTGSRCLRPPGSRALYLAEGAGRAHPPWHLLALGSPLAPGIPLSERSRQPGPPKPSLPPRGGVWRGPAWPPSVWSREGTERASASNLGPRWVAQGKPPSSRPSRARVPLKPTPKAAGQPPQTPERTGRPRRRRPGQESAPVPARTGKGAQPPSIPRSPFQVSRRPQLSEALPSPFPIRGSAPKTLSFLPSVEGGA